MGTKTLAKGSKLRAPIAELRPTQITVGALHVKRKMQTTRRQPEDRLEAFFDKHRIHVVVGPQHVLWVVDHHHWVRAWHELGFEIIPVFVRKDLSDRSEDEFWEYMLRRHQVHPYDEHGRRQPLSALPRSVAGMRDDPYRSLEAFARIAGGYRKVKQAYPDFKWADFFRREIRGPMDNPECFAYALALAVKAARSPKARGLPGYIGK
ncbi:ParB-like protein [Cupriavidus gilardii]|uniref:ParB-like protein n=1 Tax=Cupriavidus TaxID=106589 RepID=UPI0007E2F329|nr:ParB/Srx family N-terminal domain-containing protein [Cupriavidus gilardii]MCD9122703.1 ParB/Srx family N-terminal domain-containing protein [Cupriavidus sp. UGS-1]